MVENLLALIAETPAPVNQRAEEKIDIETKEDAEQLPLDLLAESESLVKELGDKTPCSEVTLDNGADLLWKMELRTAGMDKPLGLISLAQGDLLNAIEDDIKKEGRQKKIRWGKWCEQKIKFMGKRKRQNLQFLARRTDIRPYAALGVERMIQVIRASADRDGQDPAGSFLSEHGIVIPENGGPIPLDLKNQVDKVIAAAKAKRRGEQPSQQVIAKFHADASKIEKEIALISASPDLVSQVQKEIISSLITNLQELESAIPAD